MLVGTVQSKQLIGQNWQISRELNIPTIHYLCHFINSLRLGHQTRPVAEELSETVLSLPMNAYIEIEKSVITKF